MWQQLTYRIGLDFIADCKGSDGRLMAHVRQSFEHLIFLNIGICGWCACVHTCFGQSDGTDDV